MMLPRKFLILATVSALTGLVPGSAAFSMGLSHTPEQASRGHALMVSIQAEQKPDMQAGAENFVSTMARRALDFLGNAQQTQAQKTESFRRLLEDNFDMETIGRFTLGKYWKVATPSQQTEYQRLFKKRVVEMYSRRFSEYKDQKIEVRSSRPEGENDVIVTSYVVQPGSPEILVDWRVRYKNGRYRIVDVIVEGVSMSVTQRSDFSSVIQQGGGDVAVLLDHLKSDI